MSDQTEQSKVLYGIHDRPPLPKASVLALQHVLTMFGATISVPLLLGPAMGATPDQIGQMISSVMICSGVATLLQVTIGSRLPIVQGVSFSFLSAFFIIIATVQGMIGVEGSGVTAENSVAVTMQYIAGAIIGGALLEIVIGFSGLVGMIRRILTPVVIGPVIMLIGLALFPFGAPKAGQDWMISGLVIALIFLFSLVLAKRSPIIQIFPILLAILIGYFLCLGLSMTGIYKPRLTILAASSLASTGELYPQQDIPEYLTLVAHPNPESAEEQAREDAKAKAAGAISFFGSGLYLVDKSEVERLGWAEQAAPSQWEGYVAVKSSILTGQLRGQGVSIGDAGHIDLSGVGPAGWVNTKLILPWGTPLWNWGFFFAILAGFFASMIESFGDYHACSVMAGGGVPTAKQISRGIGSEGLACVTTGLLGGFASTSYSENIGLVGMTKVGSRYVVMIGAVFLMIFGFVAKLGAIVATIPEPIVGALYCALFGLISAVGMGQLAKADLRSDRTLAIAGFSLFMGLSVPTYFGQFGIPNLSVSQADNVMGSIYLWIPWSEAAQTIGQVVVTIGKSGMAVAALCGLLLDNLIPGRPEERGIELEEPAS